MLVFFVTQTKYFCNGTPIFLIDLDLCRGGGTVGMVIDRVKDAFIYLKEPLVVF